MVLAFAGPVISADAHARPGDVLHPDACLSDGAAGHLLEHAGQPGVAHALPVARSAGGKAYRLAGFRCDQCMGLGPTHVHAGAGAADRHATI